MLRMFHLIDEEGYYKEDVIGKLGEEKNNPRLLSVPIPEGMNYPKWNGSAWEQTQSTQQQRKTEPTLEQRIQTLENTVLAMMGE